MIMIEFRYHNTSFKYSAAKTRSSVWYHMMRFHIFIESNEIIILKKGKEVARLISKDTGISFLTDSLTGILKKDYNEKDIRAEWGNDTCWKGILPIRKWTELDVWLYTVWKKIPVNPKYKKGYSRVGCHCACPYYSKSTWILDKYCTATSL